MAPYQVTIQTLLGDIHRPRRPWVLSASHCTLVIPLHWEHQIMTFCLKNPTYHHSRPTQEFLFEILGKWRRYKALTLAAGHRGMMIFHPKAAQYAIRKVTDSGEGQKGIWKQDSLNKRYIYGAERKMGKKQDRAWEQQSQPTDMGYGRSFERLLRLGRRDLWESAWGLLFAQGGDYSILLPAGHIFWAHTWAGFQLVQKQKAERRSSWFSCSSTLSSCTSCSVSLWLDVLMVFSFTQMTGFWAPGMPPSHFVPSGKGGSNFLLLLISEYLNNSGWLSSFFRVV